jgi:hypothetical protein
MVSTDRFADRFLPDTYARDEGVQLDYGDPTSAVAVPERLFARAQCLARAYELHLLPTIDIHSRTRLSRAQCETLLDEINFIAMVSNDELLLEQLRRVQMLASACVAAPQRELFIEGP